MNRVTTCLIFVFCCVTDIVAEVCYEYKNSNTRAFECGDGCCGSRTDAYCCMSPILIVGIVIGSLAGILIIGVVLFVCYQKHKQRQFNKIQKIEISNVDGNPKPTKKEKDQRRLAQGGVSTTHHGVYNRHSTSNGIGGGGYNQSIFEDPPFPPQQSGTWLVNSNNAKGPNGIPHPPIQPWISTQTPIAPKFNLPIVQSLPAHPGQAELYAEPVGIRPLQGSLPPLPPLNKNKS